METPGVESAASLCAASVVAHAAWSPYTVFMKLGLHRL
jgi:hypothetical protein